MKVKALRTAYFRDRKREKMIVCKKDDIFDWPVEEKEDREDLYCGLGQFVTIVDEKYVPKSGRYICVHEFSYENELGFPRHVVAGREITLPQEQAAMLLIKGFIKPVDASGWVPKKLLEIIPGEGVKKMFDDPPEQKENWIFKGRGR